MIDAIRWLIILEALGLAIMPLTCWLLGALPDRGYGAAKIVGLLAVTYASWLIGSVFPIASTGVLPYAVLLAGASVGWWLAMDGTISSLRNASRVIAIEEILFLITFVAWCLLRAYVTHPGITHTEQPMDMALLNASIHASSYPAYDPWMSGHTINYYYLGYLMYGMVAKLSGVAPTVAFNLALSTIPALVVSSAYGVAYALCRKLWWAVLAPVFVAVIGNWHSAFVQLPSGVTPNNTFWWFWGSTRVIGGSSNITEFPFFSFLLGDLHAHVMALPVALLCVTIGCAFLFSDERLRPGWDVVTAGRVGCAAVAVGALFAINSWDFPIYLLLVAGCITAHAYLADDSAQWWRSPLTTVAILTLASIVAFTPFYLNYRSVAKGIGIVNTPSDFWQFSQVLGFFVLLAAIFVTTLGVLLQPADTAEDEEEMRPRSAAASEAGEVQAWASSNLGTIVVVAVILLVAIRFQLEVVAVLLGVGAAALLLLYRVLNTPEPNRADAMTLILIAAGCLAAAIPEVVYLKDVFQGGLNYRMNTVFKFDYQGWLLLGLSASYAAYRSWDVLRSYFSPQLSWVVLGVTAAALLTGGVYTWDAPQSTAQAGTADSLDALASLKSQNPSDYGLVSWLIAHVPPKTVELEAVGNATNGDEFHAEFGRIAGFTGLSAVMGWEGHETQWRGADPEIGTRVADVGTIYSTTNLSTAKTLLHKYGVRYVIVGETEHTVYGQSSKDLAKFGKFMRLAYQTTFQTQDPVTNKKVKHTDSIYTW